MKKSKLNEFFLLVLGALLFFIIGSMSSHLNIITSIKHYLQVPTRQTNFNLDFNTIIDDISIEPEEIKQLSLNKLFLKETEDSLNFLVAGHIYGGIFDYSINHPAMTMQTNLQLFNQMDLDMIILLGDIVQDSTEENFLFFEKNFLDYIKIPVFNAVGNHEIKNRNLYNEKYGITNYSFIYKQNLFIFVDTNIKTSSLSETQLDNIQKIVLSAFEETEIESIHIFTHHVLFLKSQNTERSSKFRVNEFYAMDPVIENFYINFLIPISEQTPINTYFGDVGAWCGNLSPFYDKFKGSNITIIATGIGNCEEDSVLIVQEVNNNILIKVFSLTGKKMAPIETYDYDYWGNK